MREACKAANLGLDCRIESSIGGSILLFRGVGWEEKGGLVVVLILKCCRDEADVFLVLEG